MAKDRPLTQKEIRARKSKSKVKNKETVTIQNTSSQLISINIRQPKGMDFYTHSRDVHLKPGVSVKLPTDKLWSTQLDRLRKRRMITVVVNSDKEMAAKKIADEREKRRILKAEKSKAKPEAKLEAKTEAKPEVEAEVKPKPKAKPKAKPKLKNVEEPPSDDKDASDGG